MTLEQRARQHYPNNPAYQSSWVRIVTLLGNRWLLANQHEKLRTSTNPAFNASA